MTRTPADAARDIDELLAEVGAALYDLDNASDTLFVRTQADGGNRAAAATVAALGSAWERYTLAKDAAACLDAAVIARHADQADALLGPKAVILPDGTTAGIAALLVEMRDELHEVADHVIRLAEAARRGISRLDAVRASASELLVRAGALGAGDDPEVEALRSAVERAVTAMAADPTDTAALTGIDHVLDAARERIQAVEGLRQGLPAELDAAAGRLAEIEALAACAADDAELARSKIAAPAGLLSPPDLSAGGDQALRPWLERIRRQADSGAADQAAQGLIAWQRAADARLADANRAADANAAPVAARNELRGLLDAYRAKAAAHGRDEDGRLARMHATARDMLYTAPCALDQAERLVREYVAVVNSMAKGGES